LNLAGRLGLSIERCKFFHCGKWRERCMEEIEWQGIETVVLVKLFRARNKDVVLAKCCRSSQVKTSQDKASQDMARQKGKAKSWDGDLCVEGEGVDIESVDI
jgi:hypothetical protein